MDSNGCPVDTDGDGVPDYLDKCPDVKGVASNNGCPEVKKEVQQLFRRALNGIQFQTGSSTILRSSYSILDEIAKTMIQNPSYKLNISGHTDNVGNADLNLKLSKDRAASVVKYLLNKNISADRLHSEGYGDTKPLVPNTTSANRAKNRRVEFEVEFIATVEE
ncbi:MAG: OmpA family protein [Bacteroidales bacterium]|nr:OmpA family protein [Bacteroidales bacterium]